MADHYLPFIESDLNADAESLRARMDEVGYLFFRHLVPSDVVNRVRRDVLAVCQEQGWLDETHDMMDAFMRPGMEPLTEGKPDYMVAYRKILHTPSFFAFPTHPALMGVMSKVLDHPGAVCTSASNWSCDLAQLRVGYYASSPRSLLHPWRSGNVFMLVSVGRIAAQDGCAGSAARLAQAGLHRAQHAYPRRSRRAWRAG